MIPSPLGEKVPDRAGVKTDLAPFEHSPILLEAFYDTQKSPFLHVTVIFGAFY